MIPEPILMELLRLGIISVIFKIIFTIMIESNSKIDKETYLKENPDTIEITFDDYVVPCLQGYVINNRHTYIVHSVNGETPICTSKGIIVSYGLTIIDLEYILFYKNGSTRYVIQTSLVIDVKPQKKYYIKHLEYENECIYLETDL